MESLLGTEAGRRNASQRHSGNDSIDVTQKTCWANYDELACVRSTSLCLIFAVSGLFCLVRLWKLHLARGPKNPHLLALFYVCSVHTIAGTIEWVFGWTTQGSLACLYLRSMELLVVTHFYLTLTQRVHHCQTDLAPRLAVLALSFLFVFFTSCVVIGLTQAESPWLDCYAQYWIWITAGHLATIQVLVLTSFLLCRKLNAVSAEESFKRNQRRQLWLVLGAFELSAFTNMAYHLIMFLLADESISCSGVFGHRQLEYSLVRFFYEVLVFLLPIWVMLWVYRPSSQPANVNSTSLGGSMLDPSLIPPPHVINWRSRYSPLSFNNLISPRTTQLPYRRLGHPRTVPRRGLSRRVRRAISAPSLRKGATPTSPPLATIPEESHSPSTSSYAPIHSAHILPSVSASVEVYLS